jgi:vacuolar-type H+-ATPase subunit H
MKAWTGLNAPATKGDIEQLRSEQRSGIEELRAEQRSGIEQLRSEMNHQYRDLVERLDDNMTRLMKAFYDAAETKSKRIALL